MDQEQSFRRNTYDSQSKLSNELTSAEVNLKQTENKYQASHVSALKKRQSNNNESPNIIHLQFYIYNVKG